MFLVNIRDCKTILEKRAVSEGEICVKIEGQLIYDQRADRWAIVPKFQHRRFGS